MTYDELMAMPKLRNSYPWFAYLYEGCPFVDSVADALALGRRWDSTTATAEDLRGMVEGFHWQMQDGGEN